MDIREARKQMLDQRNQAFSDWDDFESNYKRLMKLSEEFDKLKPMNYNDVDCNISQCRLSLLMPMMGGPHLHIYGRPNTYETYWGWAIHFGDDKLVGVKDEEIAAAYVHGFLTAKKFWEK